MEENKKSDANDQGKTKESDAVSSPANVSSETPATKLKSDMDSAVGKGLTGDKSVKSAEDPKDKDLKGSKKLRDKIKKKKKKEKDKKAKKKADKKKKEKAKKEKAQKKLKEKKAKKKSAQKKKKSKKK